MKFKTLYLNLVIAIPLIILSGCKGEQGAPGLNGNNGIDGNANVFTSQWITPSAWSGQTGDWYFDVSNTAITKDIVENGAILAYVSLKGDLYNDYTVRPLPAFALGANWDFLLLNDGNSQYGQIEFTSDMTNIPGTSGFNFRFILIPSNINLKSASLNIPKLSDLKKMSYQEVCKLLNIKGSSH